MANLEEAIKIELTSDKMEASITLVDESFRDQISPEAIKKALEAKGVVKGIKEDVVQKLGSAPVFKMPQTIAQGQRPKEGKDEEIIYKFPVDASKLEETETGSVDFKNIKNFTNFRAGTVLAEKKPAKPGEPGFTVTGDELKARDGKIKNWKVGKGAKLSDDELQVTAEVDGHACLVADRITVMNTVEVPAHVDYSIGNIRFIGNVVVRGSVRPGFTVETEGDLSVQGNIEKTHISCGGNLNIQGNIFGQGDCVIEVDGDCTVGTIDQATVRVRGNLKINKYATHSNLAAGGKIELTAKNGKLIGGDIHAYQMIDAPTIGNAMATLTKLTVGTNPFVSQELEKLQTEHAELEQKVEQVKTAIETLDKRKQAMGGKLDPKNEELYKKLKLVQSKLKPDFEKLSAELKDKKTQMVETKDAKIRVSQIIYPGVVISFRDRIQYKTQDEMQRLSFYEEDAEIRNGPY